MEKLFWVGLQMVPGIGGSRICQLISYFGNGENVWHANETDLKHSKCLDQVVLENLLQTRKNVDLEKIAKQLDQENIGICTIQDGEYPDALKAIFNPPAVLFYRGNLSIAEKVIAIVGARQASAYGCACAKKLGHALAKAGVDVISGAARGIDTAAHEGALEGGGSTIAVLGSGINVTYPRENKGLLERIANSGLVLSEYGPDVQARSCFFPARNRIISGIAQGVVVVEAALKSGSLITAELAINEGRDVFAVPGSIFSNQSRGCHRLIQQGAKLVENADDILGEYSWKRGAKESTTQLRLTPEEACVYNILDPVQPLGIDEIILKTRNTVSNVSFILLQMELRGLIAEYAPRLYIRAVKEDIL